MGTDHDWTGRLYSIQWQLSVLYDFTLQIYIEKEKKSIKLVVVKHFLKLVFGSNRTFSCF